MMLIMMLICNVSAYLISSNIVGNISTSVKMNLLAFIMAKASFQLEIIF